MWISFRFASLYCPAILPPQCLLYYQNSRSTVVADHDTKTMSATNNNDGNDVGTNEIDHGNKIPLVLLRHMLNEKVCRPKNNSLPASISMVGLGCSSFSSFFWTPDDDTNDSSSSNNQLRISCNECGEESIDRANPNVQEWIETIVYAIQCAGITLLDTAPWYGHGTSEIVIGYAMDELLSKRNDDTTAGYDPSFCRHDITINTKIGRYESDPRRQFDFSYETTISSAVRSIKRMKCQYINVLQLHDPEFAPSLDIIMNETIPAMLHCQKHGFCKGLGMTGYPLEVQHQILQKSLEVYGHNIWDLALTYSHFNLHDTSLISDKFIRYFEDGDNFDVSETSETETKTTAAKTTTNTISYMDYCHRNNIVLLAAAPLSMGLLIQNQSPPSWHPAGLELRKACHDAATICSNYGNSDLSDIAILFALTHPQIPCTVIGMKNIEQVKAIQRLVHRIKKCLKCNKNVERRSHDEILQLILTENEWNALKEISDPMNGPFAKLWIQGNYKWDGILEAQKFWKQIENASVVEWQQRPQR